MRMAYQFVYSALAFILPPPVKYFATLLSKCLLFEYNFSCLAYVVSRLLRIMSQEMYSQICLPFKNCRRISSQLVATGALQHRCYIFAGRMFATTPKAWQKYISVCGEISSGQKKKNNILNWCEMASKTWGSLHKLFSILNEHL